MYGTIICHSPTTDPEQESGSNQEGQGVARQASIQKTTKKVSLQNILVLGDDELRL
jgi:hypothetical protein